MAKTKRVFRMIQREESDAVAVYLNYMARKGWHFKEFKLGMVFEQGEPEESVYDVVVFPKGDENDYRPSPDALEFAEYCEVAGWELIDGKGQIYVFKRLREDAEPIMTAEEKVENVWKLAKKENRVWIICSILLLIMFAVDIRSGIKGIVFDAPDSSLIYLFICLVVYVRAIKLFICKKRWEKEIAAGEEPFVGAINKKNPELPVRFDKSFWILEMLMVLAVLPILASDRNVLIMAVVSLVILFGISIFNSYTRPDHEMATSLLVIVTIVLLIGSFAFMFIVDANDSISDAPLNPKQVIQIDAELDDCFNFSHIPNVLGSYTDWDFYYDDDEFVYGYQVYKSHFSYIVKETWKAELKENKKEEEITETSNTAAEWGAKKTYKVADMDYILYDQAVLEITDMDYTPEQISMIREKLGVN